MKTWAWMIPGLLFPLLFSALPGKFPIIGLAIVAIPLFWRRSPALMFFLAGAAWAFLSLHFRLETRLQVLPTAPFSVEGTVASLPVVRGDMLEFRFRVANKHPDALPHHTLLLVRWYRDFPELKAGERWVLNLRLKPARSRVNFSGPDRERWYFAQGIAALGIVNSETSRFLARAKRTDSLGFRQKVKEAITAVLAEHEAKPLVLALALADRSEITASSWERFRITGTGHVLAISGMHVGLAAIFGYWIGRFLIVIVPAGLSLRYGALLAWTCSIGLASGYSIMAGLGTSTRRALIMLFTWCFVSLLKRNTPPWQGLLLAMLLVLIANPIAALSAGFWFSFLAVMVLFALFLPRHNPRHWLKSTLVAQAGLVFVLLPLGMYWFQQFTLLGLVSNIVAIPWVSFGVIPALLLSIMALPLDNGLAAFLLFSAAESTQWLDKFLQLIEQTGQGAWRSTLHPGLFATCIAVIGTCLFLLPRESCLPYMGVLFLPPLFLSPGNKPGKLTIEMLDVGQGLAVLLETDHHLLLYDTGPGDSESWSMASTAILPAITERSNSRPDRIIVSHGDLDHAGGLFVLKRAYPMAPVMANLPRPANGTVPCLTPHSWTWDGVTFEILHPTAGLPYLGNDSSCVLSVAYGEHSVLLTGDIGSAVETRIVETGLSPHNILFAPHHGSKSSSGDSFIAAVNPDVALVSAAYQNSFNFPNPVVQQRYKANDSALLSTADCGAVRISFQPGQPAALSSARRHRPAVWRWPANPKCP